MSVKEESKYFTKRYAKHLVGNFTCFPLICMNISEMKLKYHFKIKNNKANNKIIMISKEKVLLNFPKVYGVN